MGRGRSNSVLVVRVRDGERHRAPDRVVAEEPMEIRLDGHLVTTTMRTPGNDYELAVGFLFAEGLLAGAPVREVRYCAVGSAVETEFNVVSVDTGGIAPAPVARLAPMTAACGACGSSSIDDLAARLVPLAGDAVVDVDPAAIARAAEEARRGQELFDHTGSIHAAAVFDTATGDVSLVREDVGRHNAVDKVVGRLVLGGAVPATRLGLFVSGRTSFEIVQKAWAAGFGVVAGVSGPTSLAVALARRANIALVGFARGDSMNIYAPAP